MMVARVLLILYVPAIAILLFMRVRDKVPRLCVPMDFIMLKIPLLGSAIYQLSICRYAKAFAMLYNAGVPMTEVTERAVRAHRQCHRCRHVRRRQRQRSQRLDGVGRLLQETALGIPVSIPDGRRDGRVGQDGPKITEISSDRADLLFTQFAFWMPKFVYAIIALVMAAMIFSLYSQVYGNLGNF